MKNKLIVYIAFCLFLIGQALGVTTDVSGFPIAAIVLSPILFGFLLMMGAFMLNPEEHGVLRIGLMLLSFTTYLISAWMGTQVIVTYYDFEIMQTSITTSVWIYGIMFGVIVTYFIIYAFYKGIRAAAQEKKEMMLQ